MVVALLGIPLLGNILSCAKKEIEIEANNIPHSPNEDVNAARNILAAEHAVLARGEMVQLDQLMKQELTEVDSSVCFA